MNRGHRFPRLGCCAVLFQERGHLGLVVPFRPNEWGAFILTVLRLGIGAMVEQDARHLELAMPRGHMQWRQGADDLVVEILSRNIRISTRE